MAREIELKFDVARGCGARLAAADLLAGTQAEQRDQEAVYFDTESGDLRHAGYSLRIRRSGDRYIQTAKHKPDSSAGMFKRQEWECFVPGFDLDFDALAGTRLGKLLSGKVGKNLVPLVRTKVHRTSWRVRRAGGEIDLTLDQGEIGGGTGTAEISELEVELRHGKPCALFDLATEIAEIVPLRLGVLSKAERGYAIVAGRLDKPAKGEPIRVDPTMTVAQGFPAVAYSCLRHFRLNEEALLRRPDPMALHQLRVAVRRLRSSFTLFRSAITDHAFEELREEIRWFADQLGDARNLDVFVKRLPAGSRPKQGEQAVRERLGEAREAAYATVMEALNSDRSRAMMLDLVRWIEIGQWRSRPKASKSLAPFARRQLGKRWLRIKAGGAMLADIDEETSHRLRVDVKKMRYSSEFLSMLHSKGKADGSQAEFLKALEALQEQLGDLNDAATGRALLSRLPLETPAEKKFGASLIKEPDRQKSLDASVDAYRRLVRTAGYWA